MLKYQLKELAYNFGIVDCFKGLRCANVYGCLVVQWSRRNPVDVSLGSYSIDRIMTMSDLF